MSLFSKLFGRKKEVEEEKKEIETTRPLVSEGELTILGFLSGKGGCGKSTIAANTTVLLSALYGKVIGIDMDITNATYTNMMFAATPDVLRYDDKISTLDYMVEGAEEYNLYKLEFPADSRYNIQVAKKRDQGVSVKEIYFLPAKKATVSYERNLSALAYMKEDEIKSSLQEIYVNVVNFAKRRGVKYIIFDFPPLRPDQRKVYEGVFTLLEQIPKFILISNFDFASVHGLIAIVSQRYSYIKSRTVAFFINMAVKHQETVTRIRQYIDKLYGEGYTYFIRKDPRWSVTIVPPIILGDPSEGAHADLIYALTKVGILNREVIQKFLEFDPLQVEIL